MLLKQKPELRKWALRIPALLLVLLLVWQLFGLILSYFSTGKETMYLTPVLTDNRGWEFYAVEEGTRRPLTAEELLETEGVFYITRVLSPELEEEGYTILLLVSSCPSAVFLDGELLYTTCPQAGMRLDSVEFPDGYTGIPGRGEAVKVSLPPHYGGCRLTIASAHGEYAVMPGVKLTSTSIEVGSSMAEANRHMVPAVVFAVFALLLLAGWLVALWNGRAGFSYLMLILAALLQTFVNLRKYSFVSPGETALDHPLALLVMPFAAALPMAWLALQMQDRRGRRIFTVILAASFAVSMIVPLGTLCGGLPFYSYFLASNSVFLIPAVCLAALAVWEARRGNTLFKLFLFGLAAAAIAAAAVYTGSRLGDGYYADSIEVYLTDAVLRLNLTSTIIFAISALLGLYSTLMQLIQLRASLTIQTERSEQLDLQLAAQKQFYEAQLAQENEIRALRHDMAGHLQTLNSLLEDGWVDEAKQYLDNLNQQHHAQPKRIFSQNPYMNAVLCSYDAICQENNIPFTCQVGVEQQKLPVTELCLILNNALQNAVEASLTQPHGRREIKIQAAVRQGRFILRVINRFDGQLTLRNAMPITTKGGKEHGFGLVNIRAAAQRRGGSMVFHAENGSFILDAEFQI